MRPLVFIILLSFSVGCSSEPPSTEIIVRKIEELHGSIIQDDAENIIYINLSSCEIDSSLISHLTVFKHLRYLHLEHTDLENEDLESIGKIASLEVLNINLTQTTDEGLFFLLPLNNLKELRMSHYSLTRPVPEELKEASIDDLISGKVQIKTGRDYGGGILALVKKFPALKTELWGGFPES